MSKLLLQGSLLSALVLLPVHLKSDGFKIMAAETKQHESLSSHKLVQKSFYFIRHGQTDWNIENRLQGQLDIPLNATGRAQAKALQEDVRGLDISCVYFSPLSRTQETMAIVCKNLPAITKISVPSLMERNFGEWQGEIWDNEAAQKYRNASPVSGETEEEYFDRVLTCVNDLLATTEGHVLMVAHGGVFWSLCKAAGIEYDVINNCRILHFVAPNEATDQWTIYEI